MNDVWSQEHGLAGLQRQVVEEVNREAANITWILVMEGHEEVTQQLTTLGRVCREGNFTFDLKYESKKSRKISQSKL